MVKQFSKSKLLVSIAVLASGLAYANTSTLQNKNTNMELTYSAHGTMDKKSALLLQSLLQNPNVKVRAITSNSKSKSQLSSGFSYTIKGKTTRRTAIMLKQLLQNSGHLISIQAEITKKEKPNKIALQPLSYTTHFPEYTPFYYKGVPPVYTRGNTLWYPVKINERKIASDSTVSTLRHIKVLASN